MGNAGNITAWWKGFGEYGVAPRMHGYQAEGAAPLVHGSPVENPETVASAIRIGNPARWEEATDAVTASRGEIRAVSDEEILAAYALLGEREGVFCEPASAAAVAGLIKYGAEGRVVCALTGHGLKDPTTALSRAAPVMPCEPSCARRSAGIENFVFRFGVATSVRPRRLMSVTSSSLTTVRSSRARRAAGSSRSTSRTPSRPTRSSRSSWATPSSPAATSSRKMR